MVEAKLGSKVRAQRRKRGLTQVELARRLGISASYLNLIEHNQRPLTAPLLIKLAAEFQLELSDFAADKDARLTTDLIEAFADPIFEDHGLTAADMSELAQSAPGVARAVVRMYEAYRSAQEQAEGLASRMYDDQELVEVERKRLPSEEVNDLVQSRMNYFAPLESAAEAFTADADLKVGARFKGMADWIESRGFTVSIGDGMGSALRRFDPDKRRIYLSESLPPSSRNFQLAVQIGLLTQEEHVDAALAGAEFSSDAARTLGKLVMANYFAGAVLMPYKAFLAAVKHERHDVELVAHRFGASFEQVCHRLTTLRRPGAEGVPFHMLRVDMAGNISKRFSASGIQFARFAGACPRWNVFTSFQTPGRIHTQISMMPDGVRFFCIARTVDKGRGGYHAPQSVQAIGLGCQVEHARELVYADGMDLESVDSDVAVGVTCRLCERRNCEQRAFPSLRHPMRFDRNVRGVSFYAPVD